MTNYYRVDFFKVTRNKETEEVTQTFLGSTEVNDNNVTHDLPLCRKAALRAPFGCTSWDKMRFTQVSK